MIIFFSYVFCGGIATIFDWTSFYIANNCYNLNFIYAVSLSFVIGSVVNFISNKLITFQNNYNNYSLQYIIFLIGAITALILTNLQMFYLIKLFNISPMNARMTVTFIMLFFNFSFHKLITFGIMK